MVEKIRFNVPRSNIASIWMRTFQLNRRRENRDDLLERILIEGCRTVNDLFILMV